jgi:hypothetical protein
MTDENGRNWMSCLGWGCLVVVVLTALGIGGCVAYVYRGGAAARSVADAYLEAVDAGRYEEAYEHLGSRFTEGRGIGDFVAFEQASRAQMGACGGWKMSGTSVNREAGRSVARLTYQGSCDSGPIEVGFNLERVEGRWVIEDINYHEPGVAVIPTCTECGMVLPPGARFCPNCGSEIAGGEGAPEEPAAGDGPQE